MKDLIIELTEISSPSGSEEKVRSLIRNSIEKYVDDIKIDNMGNLIAIKKGNTKGKTIMFDAHMDEIGIIINHIDKNGFLRFSPVGGFFPIHAITHRIQFQNGVIGVIGEELRKDYSKVTPLDKLYIDIGAGDKKEAEKYVGIGDVGNYFAKTIVMENRIIAKSLDDRIGCYIMIEAIKRIKKTNNTLYFAFTVQEEVGIRGARPAAFSINPDVAIAIDVTDTGDTPESSKMEVKLDGGAAIKIMDSGMLTNKKVREILISLSKKNKIPYQLEILERGTTDAFGIQITAGGIPTGAISIPSRYIHSCSEMVSINDINACIDLTVAFSKEYND